MQIPSAILCRENDRMSGWICNFTVAVSCRRRMLGGRPLAAAYTKGLKIGAGASDEAERAAELGRLRGAREDGCVGIDAEFRI